MAVSRKKALSSKQKKRHSPQIIKSRVNKPFTIIVFGASLILTTFAILFSLKKYADVEIFRMTDDDFSFLHYITTYMSIFTLTNSINILIKMKSITVDGQMNTITLKNHISGFKRSYLIDELDGFTETNFGRDGAFLSIYIIKNNIKIEKISNLYIHNFDEISNELSKLNNYELEFTSPSEKIKDTFRFK